MVYGFDANLNVQSREDTILGTKETFEYDSFSRLQRWTWNGAVGTRRTRWDYDDIGNILLRAVEAGPGNDLGYSYNSTVAGPHAVISTTLGPYKYDAKGNQIGAPGRTVTFGRQELPTRVVQTGGRSRHAITFAYDGEMSRVRTIDEAMKITADTLGGLYEFRRSNGSKGPNGKHIFTISVDARPIARRTWSIVHDALASDRIEYLHGDHQDSVDLVTSASGKVVERLKYDPFGRRVSAADPAKPTGFPQRDLRTGYTGQEHVDGWELIDMKGRFYDPILGKFLTPDPFVPNPTKPQSWNRYAYVRNNPLSLRDPTGFQDEGGEDTVTVSGDTTTITYGTADTIIGNVPGNEDPDLPPAPQALPSELICVLPPPPPPPSNDDGELGGPAPIRPPTNPGLIPGTRGDANRAARDPAAIQLRLDRAATRLASPTLATPAHTFWSGDQNKWTAFWFARRNGWITLEMSNQGLVGTMFNLMFSKESNPILTAYWYHATIEFAASSAGTVHAFIDSTGAIPPNFWAWLGSFWQRIELPVLLANPNVNVIQFHVVDGSPLGRLERVGPGVGGWRQVGSLSSFENFAKAAKDAWDRLVGH
jgi:RHS repeat-associated protein